MSEPARRGSLPLVHGAPGRPLIVRPHEIVSAGEFLVRASALAARLPRADYVLNLCEDRYEFMLAFAAALIAGQTSLMPPARADAALRELLTAYSSSYALLGTGCTFEWPASASVAGLAAGPAAELAADLAADARRGLLRAIAIDADRIACITFSSGSTGAPSAHPKTWGALWQTGVEIAARFGIGADGILGTVPPQHMYGLELTVMLPLASDAAVHAGRPLLPADIAAAAAELPHARRWLATTPLSLRALEADALVAPRLDAIVSATMPLEAGLARALESRWHVPVLEIYGCTEGGSLASRRLTADATWQTLDGITIAMRGEHAWVAGGHLPEPVPLADLITVRDAHTFTLHGRAASQVKVGGKRSSLEALNQALLAIDGVRDGTFHVRDPDRDERLSAFVVAPGRTRAELLAALRTRIDAVFLPRPLYLVDALPRNDLGKVTRQGLERLAAQLGARPRR